MLSVWISSPLFGRPAIWLCFFFLLLFQSSKASDCDFATKPPVTADLNKCVNFLKTAGAPSSINCTATKCFLKLEKLSEDDGKVILGVEKIQADGIIISKTNWTKVDFKATTIQTKPGKSFQFVLIGNRNLVTVNLPPNFIGHTLKVVDCPRIRVRSLKSLITLTREDPNSIVPRRYGSCLETNQIQDLRAVEEICFVLTGMVNISGTTVDELPPHPWYLDDRSCLMINGTNLKSLAFLVFYDRAVTKSCQAMVANNPMLCLSNRDRKALATLYPSPANYVEIKNNDDTCNRKCLSADFLAGNVAKPMDCFYLEGPILIEGDNSTTAGLDFSNVYEIREGGLTIRDTHIDYWSKFKNLRAIDTGTTAGPALSITGVKLQIPAEFDHHKLLRIWADNVTGLPVKFRDNLKYILNVDEYYYLSNLTGKAVDMGTEPIPTPTSLTVADDDKDFFDNLLHQWWFYASVGSVLLLVIVAIVATVVACRRHRFTAFSLPAVPRPASNKSQLLRLLADEILQKNPLEWSQLAQKEATKLVPMNVRENEVRSLRLKYEKFTEYTFRREPVNFKLLMDNKNSQEVYQYFKEYRKYNPTNCKMLLLSTSKDPSKTVPLFSGIVAEPTVIKGFFGDNFSQYSSSDTRSDKFEIKSTLQERNDYNNDIITYRYLVEMSETSEKPSSFQLELIHYHKWSEFSEDWKTILQLLEYGRGKKPPVVATFNPSQSWAVLMLTAVLCHVVDKSYPEVMTIAEIRKLVSHRVDCPYPADLWLLYMMRVVVFWAEEQKLLAEDKKTAFKDFGYIWKKMTTFAAQNPNNLIIKPEDLKMEKSVEMRVKKSGDMIKAQEMSDPTALEGSTDTLSDFRKQSSSDRPSFTN